jgi:alcohol dehydrogenase (cytochrome c)
LIVKGIVLQGAGMCVGAFPGGCYLVALDANTGKELWRFNTIARPGQPGGYSWNKAPVDERFGGSIWTAGSYDPELNLVYFGVGQTYKFSTLLDNYDGTPGGNDGLYTDATVALRPETGELVWYYQHMNRDVWDLDWAFERTIATINVNGKPRKTVTTAGKLNIFDTLDAATGEYLYSYDVGLQDMVTIDPKTGRKTVNSKYDPPKPNVPILKCPSTLGGRDWPATTYNAKTGILFVPENETCQEFTWIPGGNFQLNDHLMRRFNSDGMVGRVEAIDLASRKTLWVQRRRAPQVSAVLGTAGGLIFEGSRDRWFRASDQQTGKVLWQTQLNASPGSSPVTYTVNGVQYIAVVTGGGGSLESTLGAALTPEIAGAASGATLWVFKLPEKK